MGVEALYRRPHTSRRHAAHPIYPYLLRDQVMSVNLTGQFLCAREAAREFLRKGVVPELSCSAGKILFISLVHDTIPWAGHANYAASKGGVMMLMKTAAQELEEYKDSGEQHRAGRDQNASSTSLI